MRNVNIKATSGVRNDVPAERMTSADLVTGVNINIDDTGKISRRSGIRRVVTGTDVHSLGDALGRSFFIDDDTLYELSKANAKAAIKSGLTAGRRMNYLGVNNAVYFSNGVDAGSVTGSVVRNLGIAVPSSPAIEIIPGNLSPGSYGVTCAYVRDDGTESGAPRSSFIVIHGGQGLRLALPVSSDAHVTEKRVYITSANGEVPYLAMTLPNAITSADYAETGPQALVCNTQNMGPLPAGDVMGFHNGRLYSACGNVIWHSEPHKHELCNYAANYLLFPDRVTVIAPIESGIFVGTERDTHFLMGSEPAQFVDRTVSPAGSIFGTLSYCEQQFVTANGLRELTPVWVTARGVVAGASDGSLIELTSNKFVLPSMASGAAAYRYQPGFSHFLASLSK